MSQGEMSTEECKRLATMISETPQGTVDFFAAEAKKIYNSHNIPAALCYNSHMRDITPQEFMTWARPHIDVFMAREPLPPKTAGAIRLTAAVRSVSYLMKKYNWTFEDIRNNMDTEIEAPM